MAYTVCFERETRCLPTRYLNFLCRHPMITGRLTAGISIAGSVQRLALSDTRRNAVAHDAQ